MTLDRQELKRAAANRRNEVQVAGRTLTWHCQHCLRDYKTEEGFMKHFCPDRERLEELKTPKGQAAYSFYGEWMRLQRRSVPPIDTFAHSRQFNHFIKFAEWTDKTSVPNPNQFITLMVETGTQPVLWCRDTTYAMYLQWYDGVYPPEQQFIETYDTLKGIALDLGVPLNQIYPSIGAIELAKLIKKRKISPWLLVVSKNFLNWVKSLPPVERDIISEAVNFAAFSLKLRENPAIARELGAACELENI